MPSLIPRKYIAAQPLNLDEVFGERTAATRDRVITYISKIYREFANVPFEKRSGSTEEFFLTMPTVAAWDTELQLCDAILKHSLAQITDEDIKVVLKNYLDTHTFIYKDGIRELKSGNWHYWTGDSVELFYTKSSGPVNPIQYKLLELMAI
jgi:hypothetical protein